VDEALRAVADKLFPDGTQADGPDLSGLGVPILALWGQDDQIISVFHTENLPDGARIEILEDTGHMPQMESAGRTNRLIGGFLDDLE
ncbi:MAG: acetoin dehydrogenase dihydrolipoyllysine-residue acetyltransferase subunit, partial [Actinomycetota bacterium]|nr:acetoin dehydrogenase dihydrolipoyllysine-residue acetyltransferase subunit [Actinomycetota bacterium]